MDCKSRTGSLRPLTSERGRERVQGKNHRTHEGAGYYSGSRLSTLSRECEHDPAELRMTRVPPPPTDALRTHLGAASRCSPSGSTAAASAPSWRSASSWLREGLSGFDIIHVRAAMSMEKQSYGR